eukprot:15478339-Alexandrium_andersonii.AAC.1
MYSGGLPLLAANAGGMVAQSHVQGVPELVRPPSSHCIPQRSPRKPPAPPPGVHADVRRSCSNCCWRTWGWEE